MIFIILIIGIIIGGLGIYFFLKPRLTATKELDLNTSKANQELANKNLSLTIKQEELNRSIKDLSKSFQEMAENIEKTSQTMYETSKAKAETKIQLAEKEMQEQFKKQQEQLNLDYQLFLNQTKEKKFLLQNDIQSAETRLQALQSQVHSALEAARRQKELESNSEFYQITLPIEDENEIKALMSIEHLIQNKRNLYMLIWTSYYSKRVNELAARVLGPVAVMGIYKITNIITREVYIGQSRDIRTRWREHIKFSLGIDAPGGNKLYTNMKKYGIENFTFELMQKCSVEELDEREKYWINFYQSYDYGLNGNKGNNPNR